MALLVLLGEGWATEIRIEISDGPEIVVTPGEGAEPISLGRAGYVWLGSKTWDQAGMGTLVAVTLREQTE